MIYTAYIYSIYICQKLVCLSNVLPLLYLYAFFIPLTDLAAKTQQTVLLNLPGLNGQQYEKAMCLF